MVDQEISLDTLLDEFADEVTKIIEHCQINGKKYLDLERLNLNLNRLELGRDSPQLSEDDWYELIFELTPEIYDELSFRFAA